MLLMTWKNELGNTFMSHHCQVLNKSDKSLKPTGDLNKSKKCKTCGPNSGFKHRG